MDRGAHCDMRDLRVLLGAVVAKLEQVVVPASHSCHDVRSCLGGGNGQPAIGRGQLPI